MKSALTPNGSKPIEAFQPGDLVLSRDEKDVEGLVESKIVEEVFVRYGQVLTLVVLGREIGTTGEHPFWVQGKGWLQAVDIRVGDQLVSHDGQASMVQEVRDTGKWQVVYNLRIADYHTYFVGCAEWGFSVWAHNANNYHIAANEDGTYALVKVDGNKQPTTVHTAPDVAGVVAHLESLPANAKGELPRLKLPPGAESGLDPAFQAHIDALQLDPKCPSTVARVVNDGEFIGVSSDARSMNPEVNLNAHKPNTPEQRQALTNDLQQHGLPTGYTTAAGNEFTQTTFQVFGHAEYSALHLAAESTRLPAIVKVDTNRQMCSGPPGSCSNQLGRSLTVLPGDQQVQTVYTRDQYGNVIRQNADGSTRRIGKMDLETWNAFNPQ